MFNYISTYLTTIYMFVLFGLNMESYISITNSNISLRESVGVSVLLLYISVNVTVLCNVLIPIAHISPG